MSHNEFGCIPTEWFGVLFVHDGLFQGAIFRFTVRIPAKFPSCADPPGLTFDPIPFHPLVRAKSGLLNTSIQFPVWDGSIHRIWQLILYAKKIFYSLETDIEQLKERLLKKSAKNSLKSDDYNHETVRLFYDDYEGFQAKISENVQESRVKVYEPPADADDRNAILFGPWNPETHETTRRAFLAGQSPDSMDSQSLITATTGLSWIQTSPTAQFRSFS